MSLDSKTVANIANLARIRVPEADLPGLAQELTGIMTWIEQLNEVDTKGVQPMSGVLARDHAAPGRCGDRRRRSQQGAGQCAGAGSRLLHRPQSGRVRSGIMSDLTHLTIADALDGIGRQKFSARELTDAHITKMGAAKGLNAYITETPDKARAAGRRLRQAPRQWRQGRRARRYSARHQGPVLHRRRSDDRGLAHPGRLQADL